MNKPLSPAMRRVGIAIGIVLLPVVFFAQYAFWWLVDRYLFRL